jgi:uncharacterized protein (TIGR02284 family)
MNTPTRDPITSEASVAEASARLKRDHAGFEASLERLSDYAAADDAELVVAEWNELEASLLCHMDAEEMFLIPAFRAEDVDEAKLLLTEHAEIRERLGELGLAVDLHTLRTPAIERLYRAVASHAARETRTLYAWAEQPRHRVLLEAIARRLPRPRVDRQRPDSETVATLLTLMGVSRDGEQGYRHAVEDTTEPALRAVFSRLAEERGRFARTLRDELRRLGVDAQLRGTALGTIHRGWLDATAKRGSARAILRECERGEELALRAYRSAMRAELPPTARVCIDQQRGQVERALDEVRALAATTR